MKKLALMKILAFIMISFAFACDQQGMSRPEVEKIVPKNSSNVTNLRPEIFIEFSKEMNKPLTEENISIYSEKHNPVGYYRWKGNVLYYDLKEDLKKGNKYIIKVNTLAEDDKGNNIKDIIYSSFSVGDDFTKPYLVSTSPLDGVEDFAVNGEIVLEFSEQIEPSSLEKGFSINPSIVGYKEMSADGKTMVFKPLNDFDNRTTYTISLTTDITDMSGNPLLESRKLTFSTGTDKVPPSLEGDQVISSERRPGIYADGIRLNKSSLNNGVEKDAEIIIQFSEPMNRVTTSDAISISPNTNYKFEWDKSDTFVKLIFDNNLTIGSYYTISVGKASEDKAKNALDDDYEYSIAINGTNSSYLSVAGIYQVDFTGNEIALSDESSIDLTAQYVNYSVSFQSQNFDIYKIRIYFNSDVIMNNLNYYDDVQFSYLIYKGALTATDPKIYKITNSGSNYIDIHLYSLAASHYYELKITGGASGLLDSRENYLKNDFYIYFNN